MNRRRKNAILEKASATAFTARLMAKGIDFFIVLILYACLGRLGILLGLTYIAVSDGIQSGQSVGKKFVGFAVIGLEDGQPCSIQQSAIRNLPFLTPLFLALIPLWGLVFSICLGGPLVVLELYLLVKLDSGRRLGDVMADTSVMANDGNRMKVKAQRTSWFKANPHT